AVPVSDDLTYDLVSTEEPNTTIVVAPIGKTLSTDNNALLLDNLTPMDTNKHSN
ncbi:4956_t:CDS:1, partial [Dentiscutata heterogama]